MQGTTHMSHVRCPFCDAVTAYWSTAHARTCPNYDRTTDNEETDR